MKAKTFKRMSKRFISTLLSVMMVVSLFTVCAVGSAVTASAYDTLSGVTMYFDNSSTMWSKVYVNVIKGSTSTYTYYEMSVYDGDIYSITFDNNIEWKDRERMRFTPTNNSYDSYSADISDINSSDLNGKLFTPEATGGNFGLTVTVYGSSGDDDDTTVVTRPNTAWLPVTLFNYRNGDQISDATSKYGTSSTFTETPAQSYAVDSKNGEADEGVGDNGKLHDTYNDAVSNWFKNKFTGKGTNVTPLYQGNFWSAKDDKNIDYYHFMYLANCANQSDTNAVAQGLVDDELNADGNITQLGLEMPQFSKKFMESVNTGADIQSIYENLKFETNAIKNSNENIWYSYNSAVDGNRSLNTSNSTVSGIDSDDEGTDYDPVYGTNSSGGSTDAGFFPFNKPGDSHTSVTNSFGARFDITFVMTKDGTLNGEDLQFNFSGDDDLWVYIDGHLALDMGGSHNKSSGYINLNTSKMESYASNGQYTATYDSNNIYTSGRTSEKKYKSLKTVDGSPIEGLLKDTTREHTMTIFYLERGMFDSNLSFSFMLPQTNSLKIEQKVDTTNVNAGLLKETLNTADKDVHEVVLKSNSKDAPNNDTAEIPVVSDFKRVDADGAYALLQHGTGDITNASGVPFNNTNDAGGNWVTAATTTFVWEDTNTNLDGTKKSFGTGTGVVGSAGEVDLLYNQSATFNDQFALGSKFQLIPTDNLSTFVVGEADSENPPASKPSTRTASKYYTQTSTITDNEGNKIVAFDSDGNAITDTNVIDANKYYNFGTADAHSAKVKATYTNTVKTGTVKFTKKLDEGTDSTTTFEFAIEFANIFGGNDTDAFDEYPITYKILKKGSTTSVADLAEQPYNSTDGIELYIGDTAIIEGIPIDTKYRIIEASTSDPSKNYSVASVTEDTNSVAGAVEAAESTKGGIVATVGTVTGNNDNVAHLNFNNTTNTTKVVYRFKDRNITTGLPTSMEEHYTYFTREIPGTLTGTTDQDKNTILRYAPTMKNLMCTYKLTTNDIEFNHQLTDGDLKSPAEGTENLTAGTVILATYTSEIRKYNINVTYPDTNGNLTSYTKDYPFNAVIELGEIKAPAIYYTPDADGDGKKEEHNFRYWAKLVNVDGARATTYTPVSTNYSYAYRVTDDAILRAVYDTDPDFKQLEAPIVVDDADYNVSGDGSGYDASTAERVYDSYSKDVKVTDTDTNVTTTVSQDRTRINVLFGALGSKDVDQNIKDVGYVLVKNDDKHYATDNLFTDKILLEQITAVNAATAKVEDINGKKYESSRIKTYSVNGYGYIEKTEPKIDPETGEVMKDPETGKVIYVTKWVPGYTPGKYNLTNKNRVNFVFDLKNDASTLDSYYTCYTFMRRLDYVYDESGNIEKDVDGEPKMKLYTYVSETPAYFNLREAEPYSQEIDDGEKSYTVSDFVRDQTGKLNTNAGRIGLSKLNIKDGQKLVITITPTNHILDNKKMVSTLTSLKIGTIEIPETEFESYTISKTGESVISIIFDKETHLPENLSTLEVTANFNVEENKTHLNIDVSGITCTNGTLAISGDGGTTYGTSATIKKGESYILKATPNIGYVVKHWEYPDGTKKDAGVTELTLSVATDDTATEDAIGNKVYYVVPTPVFEMKNYNVTIEAKAGGSVVYSYTGQPDTTIAGGNSEPLSLPAGTVLSLEVTDVDTANYTFTGWSTGSTDEEISYTVNSDVTITANIKKNANVVYFVDVQNWGYDNLKYEYNGSGGFKNFNSTEGKAIIQNTGKTASYGNMSGTLYIITLPSDKNWFNVRYNDQSSNFNSFKDGYCYYNESGENQPCSNNVFEGNWTVS